MSVDDSLSPKDQEFPTLQFRIALKQIQKTQALQKPTEIFKITRTTISVKMPFSLMCQQMLIPQ